MNFHQRAKTNERQAARQGDAVTQIDTTEKLEGAPESGNSLFALCWLGLTGIAMLGWIGALGYLTWRFAGWLLF